MTEQEAIGISIELWKWLARTGADDKGAWPGWMRYGGMENDCPLCEYSTEHELAEGGHEIVDPCTYCPYYQKFGTCIDGPYWDWRLASEDEDAEARIDAAKRFLSQLRRL